jgi:hypothetical protein
VVASWEVFIRICGRSDGGWLSYRPTSSTVTGEPSDRLSSPDQSVARNSFGDIWITRPRLAGRAHRRERDRQLGGPADQSFGDIPIAGTASSSPRAGLAM